MRATPIPALILLGALLLCSGCDTLSRPSSTETVVEDGEALQREILRSSRQGIIILILTPHPMIAGAPAGGVRRAAVEAARHGPCSAAAFPVKRIREAQRWLQGEVRARQATGQEAHLVLGGHSWGATAASETTKWILKHEPATVVDLLVTVDAIKSSTLGHTTGLTTTILTLNNPIPGKQSNWIAYDDTPEVDGARLLAHTNYYQAESALYHGARISTATENYRIERDPAERVNHGNVDDLVYPYVVADLCAAVEQGMLR